jgi:hypothetical protein
LKNYLFIIRSYNDIDHFTPILDFMMKNKLAKVFLYSSAPIQLILPNENLDYLKKEYGLEPLYLLDPKGNFFIKILERVIIEIKLFNTKALLPKIIELILNHITKRLRFLLIFIQKITFENFLTVLFRKINPDLVIYDWTNPDMFPYSIITKNAKKSKIPVVSIPHGLYIYLSTDPTGGGNNKFRLAEDKRINNNMNFDWYVVQNNIKKKHILDCGIKEDSIVSMGSLRYEQDWLKKQKEVFSKNKYNLSGDDVKIVIFPSKLHYKGLKSAYTDIIEQACQLSNRVVLKPHTRHMRLHDLKASIKSSGIKVVTNQFSSTELINWCDIGIVWGSSIGIQLVVQNKKLFYPRYAHDLETIYDKYLPEIVVNNTEELIEGIKKHLNNKNINYSDKSKNKFIEEVIYGGDMAQSPLQKYTQFFDKIARGI